MTEFAVDQAGPGEGVVVRKKKGEEEEEAYFIAGGRKNNGRAKPSTPAAETNSTEAAGSQRNVPLPTLTALLSLSISPPTSTAACHRGAQDDEFEGVV